MVFDIIVIVILGTLLINVHVLIKDRDKQEASIKNIESNIGSRKLKESGINLDNTWNKKSIERLSNKIDQLDKEVKKEHDEKLNEFKEIVYDKDKLEDNQTLYKRVKDNKEHENNLTITYSETMDKGFFNNNEEPSKTKQTSRRLRT